MRERGYITQSRRGRLAARLAALTAIAGIPVHVYWAAGGTWGLPGGVAAAGLPGLRITNLEMALLLACGAAWLAGLTTDLARRVPADVALAPVWAGAVICMSHAIFGLTTRGLYLAGVRPAISWPERGLTAAQRTSAALHDVSLSEPWFLLLGLLLAWAAYQYISATAGRRWWIASLGGCAILVAMPGLILVLTHHRVAFG